MKNVILESELSRIKEMMGLQTINEASEVMPQANPYKDLVADLVKKYPEVKNVCSTKEVNQSTIDNIFMKPLTKLFGEKTTEFMTKFKDKAATMDKSEMMQTINTLKGYLTKPKEGFEFMKQLVGMDTNEEVSEQVAISGSPALLALGLVGVALGLFYMILTLISLAFGYNNVNEFIGCQRRF